MQMSVADYEEITLGQFINKIHGFYQFEGEIQKSEWMRTNYRIYNALMLSPDVKPINKPKTFEAFLEGGNKPKRITTKAELDKWMK